MSNLQNKTGHKATIQLPNHFCKKAIIVSYSPNNYFNYIKLICIQTKPILLCSIKKRHRSVGNNFRLVAVARSSGCTSDFINLNTLCNSIPYTLGNVSVNRDHRITASHWSRLAVGESKVYTETSIFDIHNTMGTKSRFRPWNLNQAVYFYWE
jgi:hypothetical protein